MSAVYDYASVLSASERVTWRIEAVLGGGDRLDFTRPFLPECLARTATLDFLSDQELLLLNQIRGHAYLAIVGLAEEFILPFVLDHVHPGGDSTRARALLAFASEEAKHIELFRRFRTRFEDGFGSPCGVMGPPETIARAVLEQPPLTVALVVLHFEWMTQRHYLQSVRDEQEIEPRFASLLRHHWLEESQHAKLDTNLALELAAQRGPMARAAAVQGYLGIVRFLDHGLRCQAELDLESLEAASGRRLRETERTRFLAVQHQANRWTYLGSGMSHPQLLQVLQQIDPNGATAVSGLAKTYC